MKNWLSPRATFGRKLKRRCSSSHRDRARSDCVLLPFWIYLELFCTLRKEIQFTHSIFNSDPDAISLSKEMSNYKIVELVEGADLVAASGESSLGHTESVHWEKTETVAGLRNDKKEQQLQFLQKAVENTWKSVWRCFSGSTALVP